MDAPAVDKTSTSNLIDDVTNRLEALFTEFRRYHFAYLTDPTYPDYEKRFQERLQTVRGWSSDQSQQFTTEMEAEVKDRERINAEILEQFLRLDPDTMPSDDPHVARRMLWMLYRISQAYKREGARRGASITAILGYMYQSGMEGPHVSWYATRWLASALVERDYLQAEVLIRALTHDSGADPHKVASHAFARYRDQLHALPMARACIAMNRDHDVEKALEYAGHARRNCAHVPGVVEFSQAVEAAHHHLLESDHAACQIDPTFLLTGSTPTLRSITDGAGAPLLLTTHEGDDHAAS